MRDDPTVILTRNSVWHSKSSCLFQGLSTLNAGCASSAMQGCAALNLTSCRTKPKVIPNRTRSEATLPPKQFTTTFDVIPSKADCQAAGDSTPYSFRVGGRIHESMRTEKSKFAHPASNVREHITQGRSAQDPMPRCIGPTLMLRILRGS